MADQSLLRPQHLVTIQWRVGEESVNVTFDREALTPALFKQMTSDVEAGDLTASAAMLAKVIVEWDVTDGDNPWPATAENLSTLSITSLSALSNRIADAAVPSDAEGNASSDTSSTPSTASTTPQASPQNGPEPSPSPQPSASPSPT